MGKRNMTCWNKTLRIPRILAASLAIAIAVPAATLSGAPVAQASDIKVTVNNQAITTYDISRRVAFLRLQRRSGNLNQMATDELIEEALKRDAMQRAGYRIPDSRVNEAFANFAASNKMSAKQMTTILNQSGVTANHFKEYVRTQIGWGQLVAAQTQAKGGLMSEQDVVAKMLERGGAKPTSTEYTLQKIIFVVPNPNNKGVMGARRNEANQMRSRVGDCANTIPLAAQLRDVTVQDLGRVLELSLPERWKDDIKGLAAGQSTRPKDSENGIEFILVCRAKTVSDDRVAQLEFSTEALKNGDTDVGKDMLQKVRENSRIVRR